MKRISGGQASCLTVLAVFCRCLMWFPIWMLMLSLWVGSRILPAVCILTVCGTVSGCFAALMQRKTGTLRFLALLIGFLLHCGCFYLLLQITGSVIGALLLTIPLLIDSICCTDKPPAALYPPIRLGLMLTGAVIAVILLHTADLPISMDTLLIACSLAAVCWFLLRNQLMLYRMVNRRSIRETDVPDEIRRSNLVMVAVMLCAVILIFLCRAPLIALLNACRDLLLLLIRFLLSAFTRLIAWLGGEKPEYIDIGGSERDPALSNQSSNPLWMLLWIPFIAVIVFVWRMFLADMLHSIRDLLLSIREKLRARQAASAAADASQDDAFTDISSDALPERGTSKSHRAWRKALRNWRKTPDAPEKFYAGYQLLLRAPAWEQSPREADTAREICAAWHMQYPDAPMLHAPTDALESDRYALNGLPENAIAELDSILTKIAQIR